MTSKKQIEANHRNALQSTGPKTTMGKNKSRQNAFKHGLTSKTIIAYNEDADELETLVASVLDELQPGSQMEHEVATRIATIMWRIRRVPGIEAGLLSIAGAESQMDSVRIVVSDVTSIDPVISETYESLSAETASARKEAEAEMERVFELAQARLAEGFRRDANHGDTLGRLSRYEGVLMRQLERSFELFHKLNMARMEQTVALNEAGDLNDFF